MSINPFHDTLAVCLSVCDLHRVLYQFISFAYWLATDRDSLTDEVSGYLPQPPIKHLRPGQTPIRSSAPQVKAPRSLAPINDVGRIGSGVRVSASFPKNARVVSITSVSKTIRKPPLIKAQTAYQKTKKIKYGEKRFSMADVIITPCNVACGSGMTCHGIRPNVRHIRILHLV